MDNYVGFLRVKDPKIRKERLQMIIDYLYEQIRNNHPFTNLQLRTMVRMAKEVPFSKIRKEFNSLLEELGDKVNGMLDYPCSLWIEDRFLTPIDQKETPQSKIFKSAFLLNGKVTHLDRIMAFFPDVLEINLEINYNLMNMDGPLPFYWRNYIAILAAARFNCDYLVRLQQEEFLSNGGDKEWLEKGLKASSMPKKIVALAEFNALLAHCPWKVGNENISELIQGGEVNEAWGLNELVHAILIIIQFHCLSGIVFGLGIENEVDSMDAMSPCQVPNNTNKRHSTKVEQHKELGQKTIEFVQRALIEDKYKLHVSRESWMKEKDKGSIWSQSENNEKVQYNEFSDNTLKCYKCDANIVYQDFDTKHNFMRSTDFNWSKDTYGQLARFQKDLAPLLDREFNLVKTMTDFSFSDTGNVDTSAFRESIWQYAQRLQGVFEDSYNYHEVNILLNKEIKLFIKKVVCIPESVTVSDFSNIGYHFRPDEKLHITLLSLESRKQSIMTYAFIAIKKFLTQKNNN
eukprot:TRINITY_DN6241_c0_g2_i1.p1 TRINITY_DN6241_c0_g2~~TRINITY_DN6241_c0_g2_i1.p1  ORF type:complete len:576 (+),score=135.49 TRINITY_DN6241_c0_g2_i1:183-1730(+)